MKPSVASSVAISLRLGARPVLGDFLANPLIRLASEPAAVAGGTVLRVDAPPEYDRRRRACDAPLADTTPAAGRQHDDTHPGRRPRPPVRRPHKACDGARTSTLFVQATDPPGGAAPPAREQRAGIIIASRLWSCAGVTAAATAATITGSSGVGAEDPGTACKVHANTARNEHKSKGDGR